MWGETRCNSECWYTLLKIQLLVRWWSKELLIRAWVSCNTYYYAKLEMYRAYYKVNTPLLHLFPTPQSHFKVHCTHKFTFTSLQFWKKKNSFPFVISNFPVAFFIFSLLFLALPPEWKLKVGKLIDFLRFPSVQKKEKGLYGMIHILSFIDNHKSSPKENLCICRSSAVAPAAIFFAPGVVSAVETKFNWICNAVNFFHVRRVRGPFLSSFSFLLQRKRGKVL